MFNEITEVHPADKKRTRIQLIKDVLPELSFIETNTSMFVVDRKSQTCAKITINFEPEAPEDRKRQGISHIKHDSL